MIVKMLSVNSYAATIFLTGYGTLSPHTSWDKKVSGDALLAITDCLLTQCSGYCVPEPLGATCLLNMVAGKTPIVDFAAGAIRGCGPVSRSVW